MSAEARRGHGLSSEARLSEARLSVTVLGERGVARDRVEEILKRGGFQVVTRIESEADLSGAAVVGSDAVVAVAERFGSGEAGRLRHLAQSLPNMSAVLVVSVASRRDIRDALAAGAQGLVVDDQLERQLGVTVRAVCAGQLAVPALFREPVAKPRLTAREKQILAMVVMGFTNQEIANRLFIAEATVKSHLTSAFSKLGVSSRSEATAFIVESDGIGTGILTLQHEPV